MLKNPSSSMASFFDMVYQSSETGLMKAILMEDLNSIKKLIQSGKSINTKGLNGNSPLHAAVIRENVNIMKFLLGEDDIDLNIRNMLGQTPLLKAVTNGSFEIVELLIGYGADVNIPDNCLRTPIHSSVQFPNITKLLLENGADINAVDHAGNSALHCARHYSCLETACLLLYYNIDTSIRDKNNRTVFMHALFNRNDAFVDILLDYVDDFDEDGIILDLAIRYEEQFIEEMFVRGAKVNAVVYNKCLKLWNPRTFEVIWRKLLPEDAEQINLFAVGDLRPENFEAFLDVLLANSDSSMLAALADTVSFKDVSEFIDRCSEDDSILDKLTKLLCVLLENGFRIGGVIIQKIFFKYGYCELFKLLLFMDYDSDWGPSVITSKLIFDVESSMKTTIDGIISGNHQWKSDLNFLKDVNRFLCYWIYRPLEEICHSQMGVNAHLEQGYFKNRTTVPSLLQLARDRTREHIVKTLKLKTTCQYYTTVNHLNITSDNKQILMFERPVYNIC